MDRTFHSYRDLVRLVENLRNTELTDDGARLVIYSLALEGHVIAPSQLGKVHSWYFTPELVASDQDRDRGFSDVEPRTANSVMNAVTRVAREHPPHRQQDIGIQLSAYLADYFRMAPYEPQVPEAS